ncbi:MAG: hypothetical protein ACRDHK_08580 [Actinomycetota bacterium]
MAEATRATGACSVHPDREAVELCRSCGRRACLTCAIPVRGRVLCAQCAAREIGAPAPPPERAGPSLLPDIAVLVFLIVGLATSVWPWDRFGARTALFSAWTPTPEPWPLITSVALLVAAGLGVARLARLRTPFARRAGIGIVMLSLAGALAAGITLLYRPGFATRTIAPVVALAASLLAVAILLLRRRPHLTAHA